MLAADDTTGSLAPVKLRSCSSFWCCCCLVMRRGATFSGSADSPALFRPLLVAMLKTPEWKVGKDTTKSLTATSNDCVEESNWSA